MLRQCNTLLIIFKTKTQELSIKDDVKTTP